MAKYNIQIAYLQANTLLMEVEFLKYFLVQNTYPFGFFSFSTTCHCRILHTPIKL